MGEGMVFLGQLDANVVALDAKTGKEVWKTPIEVWQDGYGVTSAPLYYDGIVYSGITGGEYGVRGRIAGLVGNGAGASASFLLGGATALRDRHRHQPDAAGAPQAARRGLAVPCGAPIMEAHQRSALAHWAASQAACSASKSCW